MNIRLVLLQYIDGDARLDVPADKNTVAAPTYHHIRGVVLETFLVDNEAAKDTLVVAVAAVKNTCNVENAIQYSFRY